MVGVNTFLQLVTVLIGTAAAMVAARALVELLVRAERKSRLDDVVYRRPMDRW